jgi:hypothetical protein
MDIDPICGSTYRTVYDTAVSIRMVIISAQLKTCTCMNKKTPKPQPLSSDVPYIPCSFRLRELLQQVGTSGYDRPCTDRSRVLLSSIPSWSGYAAVSRRELCSKCIVSKNFKTRARRTYVTAVTIPSSCAATHHDLCYPIFFKDPPSLLDGFYSLTLAHGMRGYIGPLCWHDT